MYLEHVLSYIQADDNLLEYKVNNGETYFYTVLDSHTEKDAVMTASPGDKITALEPKDESGVSNSKIFSYHPLKMIEELYEKYQDGWF